MLCNRVLQSLEISEVLDVIKNYNLKYPEIKENQNKINFNDWLDDDEFIENYPTVIFWCYRFNNYFNQFPIFKGNETEIPFWFFIFRILSSLKCVVMEDKNNTKQVNFTIEIYICREFLRHKKQLSPPDVIKLIKKYILPVRLGRKDPRKVKPQSVVSFLYRVA